MAIEKFLLLESRPLLLWPSFYVSDEHVYVYLVNEWLRRMNECTQEASNGASLEVTR